MTITFLQLSKQLEGLAKDLTGPEQGKLMGQLASEALALNKKRVQETGRDTKGDNFKPYSTKPMLSGSKNMTASGFNSIAGSKDKRRDLDWVTLKGHRLFTIPGGYKQFRELQGRQTGFVDFTFYGRMWNNIKLVSNQSELNSGIAVLKATQELEKKKLSGNTERRGEILGLSSSEEKQLSQHYETWVSDLVKKNGFK